MKSNKKGVLEPTLIYIIVIILAILLIIVYIVVFLGPSKLIGDISSGISGFASTVTSGLSHF